MNENSKVAADAQKCGFPGTIKKTFLILLSAKDLDLSFSNWFIYRAHFHVLNFSERCVQSIRFQWVFLLILQQVKNAQETGHTLFTLFRVSAWIQSSRIFNRKWKILSLPQSDEYIYVRDPYVHWHHHLSAIISNNFVCTPLTNH